MGKKWYSFVMSQQEQTAFGRLAKAARAELGMSQEELAEAAQVSRRTIGNIENGRHEAQPEVKARIRRALAMDEIEQPDDIEALLVSIRILLDLLDAQGRARVVTKIVEMIGVELAESQADTEGAPHSGEVHLEKVEQESELSKEDLDLAAMHGHSVGVTMRDRWDREQETPEPFYDGDDAA